MVLAGNMSSALFAAGKSRTGWDRVEILGWQSREGVSDLLSRARVGVAILKPLPNYLDSYPTKLFEYMAAGLPSVVSDFVPWRAIVEDTECGVLVDPLDIDGVVAALSRILKHPDAGEAMGHNGLNAIVSGLNWDAESSLLTDLYRDVLK